MHGAENEYTDEHPVSELEEAVPPTTDVIDRCDPHWDSTEERHPPRWNTHSAMKAKASVDRLADDAVPSSLPNPDDNKAQRVQEDRGEGQVTNDRVVEHSALEGDPKARPQFAVPRNGDEYRREVG